MEQIPTSKVTLKKEIKQIMEILRSCPNTPQIQTLINSFQVFSENSLQKDQSYLLLKKDYQGLKLKYNQKTHEIKKISKENSHLKKNLQAKVQQVSRLTFNKKANANRNKVKQVRPNNMFDYDLLFQRGKSQDWAVQTQDILAAYELKIQKLREQNQHMRNTIEHYKTQYHQKLTQNECLRELLSKYVEDLKIGSDNDQNNDQEDMVPRSETISELEQQCQSYCSQTINEDPKQEICSTPIKTETIDDFDEAQQQKIEVNIENSQTGVIWQAYKQLLGYFKVSKQ